MLALKHLLAMRSPLRLAALATISTFFTSPALGQTYSSCNPTSQSGCPADPALGTSLTVNFANGASNDFTAQGAPTYNSNGAAFTVAQSGNAPTLISKWYIMFGKLTVKMKAAPGTGIVSSVVLQSDDLDEIDWEWLGGSGSQVQSNYFGKGQTTTYDRAAVHAVTNTQGEWHEYTTEWNENQIIWSIDGNTVRVLNAGDANGQYPQTPMQLKLGAWAGGDPSNSQGTINWAGGQTNYAAGPFTMYVSEISVVDYSTGKSYSYGDTSGKWESIESNGGKVNGNAGGSVTVTSAPAITSTTSGQDAWDGTHRTELPSVSYTSLYGLPSGWTVSGSGKVIPPSAAPVGKMPTFSFGRIEYLLTTPQSTSQSASSTSSPAASPAALCSDSGYKVTTAYNQQGFLTVATLPAGASVAWDAKGLPTTILPANCMVSNTPMRARETLAEAVQATTTSSQLLLATADSSALITAQITKTSDSRDLAPWMAATVTLFVASALIVFLA